MVLRNKHSKSKSDEEIIKIKINAINRLKNDVKYLEQEHISLQNEINSLSGLESQDDDHEHKLKSIRLRLEESHDMMHKTVDTQSAFIKEILDIIDNTTDTLKRDLLVEVDSVIGSKILR